MKVDFPNIGQRILSLPLPARRYTDLQVGKGGTVFAIETPTKPTEGEATSTVHRFDLLKRRADVIAGGLIGSLIGWGAVIVWRL